MSDKHRGVNLTDWAGGWRHDWERKKTNAGASRGKAVRCCLKQWRGGENSVLICNNVGQWSYTHCNRFWIRFWITERKGNVKVEQKSKRRCWHRLSGCPIDFTPGWICSPFPRCKPTTLTHSGDIIPYPLCQPHWSELQASSTCTFLYPPVICFYIAEIQHYYLQTFTSCYSLCKLYYFRQYHYALLLFTQYFFFFF